MAINWIEKIKKAEEEEERIKAQKSTITTAKAPTMRTVTLPTATDGKSVLEIRAQREKMQKEQEERRAKTEAERQEIAKKEQEAYNNVKKLESDYNAAYKWLLQSKDKTSEEYKSKVKEMNQKSDAYKDALKKYNEDYAKESKARLSKTNKESIDKVLNTAERVVATPTDIVVNVGQGFLNIPEGIVDFATYAIAQAYANAGNTKEAERLRRNAQVNVTQDKWLGNTHKYLDEKSYIPEIGDEILQGVGYSATLGGLNLIPGAGKVISDATLVASSMGSSLNEAYSQPGVSDVKAWTKAGLSSGLELGVEKLFGVLGYGGSSIDDILQASTENIKNSLAKAITQTGITMTGEGVEELLSYAGNYLIDHGLDLIDTSSKLGKEWDSEEFWKNFFVGAISAGISQGSANIFKSSTVNNEQKTLPTATEVKQTENTEQNQINSQVLPTAKTQTEERKVNTKTQSVSKQAEVAEYVNEKNVASELRERMQSVISGTNKISNSDVKLEFASLDENKKAQTDGNTITIDVSKSSLRDLIHEITHNVETSKGYIEVSDYILTELDKRGELQAIKDEIRRVYEPLYTSEGRTFTEQDLDSEIVARYTEKFANDENFVSKITQADRNFAQKICDWIREKVNYYRTVKKLTAEQRAEYDELKRAEKLWLNALKHSEKASNSSSNIQYSIENVEKYNENEYNNTRELKLSSKEYGILSSIINSDTTIKPGLNYVDVTNGRYIIYYKGYGEFKVVAKKVDSDAGRIRKRNDNSRIKEGYSSLLESTGRKETSTRSNDEISNFNKKRNGVSTRSGGSGTETIRNGELEQSSSFSMPNNKYSISTDNNGRQLTKEQQEYFKDSKVRDEQGRLIKVYHGTQYAGFTEFSHKNPSIGNYRYGDKNVNFFTTNRYMAISYSDALPSEAEKINTPKLSTMEEVHNAIAEKNNELLEANRTFNPEYSIENRLSIKEEDGVFNLYDESELMHTFKNETDIIRNINSVLRSLYGGGEFSYNEGYYEGYLNITNPYIVDAEGRNWKFVGKEYSQELEKKYNSLTQVEKETLTKIAIDNGRIGFSQILDKAHENAGTEFNHYGYKISAVDSKKLASAYKKLMQHSITPNMKDVFYVAEKSFSQEAIEIYSERDLTTNDIVKKAIADGSYDGVIIKNVVDYGSDVSTNRPGDLYITLNSSNQFKDVDNLNPTDDQDIRYSLEEDTKKERKHYKSIATSEMVGEQGKKIARNLLENDRYIPVSNQNQMDKAISKINNVGLKEAVIEFRNKVKSDKRLTPDDLALGERLIQEYSRGQDIDTLNELIQDVALAGTELGQSVQALSLIQKMTPEGQLMLLQKSINRINLSENTDIKLTKEQTKKIVEAKNEQELQEAISEATIEIAEQIPLKITDKLRSWRYLSMLGNLRTHKRNIVSNVAMKGAKAVKDTIASAIEDVINPTERTRTLKRASKEVKTFAKMDAEERIEMIASGGKYDVNTLIKQSKRQFNNRVLNALAEFNSNALEAEDKIFLKSAYAQALSNYMTANNLTAKYLQSGTKEANIALTKARDFAMLEAQVATFRQFSYLATWISQLENKNNFSKVVVGGLLPFKKTPINIAKTGMEYSPVGLVKNITYDIVQLKKGNINASKFIDNISKGLTGTSISLIGYFLAQAGILKASGDDDDRAEDYDTSIGNQQYAINVGNKSFTIDWLTPSAMPLFVGAEFYNATKDKNEINLNALATATTKTLNPLTEMSMLQSFASTLSSFNTEGSAGKLGDMGANMIESYIGQYFPTIVGQLARIIDDTERETYYTDKKGAEARVQRFVNKQVAKTPFLSKILEPRVDVWGEEVKRDDNIALRAFNQLINPAYVKTVQSSNADKEVQRLYKASEDSSVLPKAPGSTFSIDAVEYKLTPEEYTTFKKTVGKYNKNVLNNIATKKEYTSLSDVEKIKTIEALYKDSTENAKQSYADKNKINYDSTDDVDTLISKKNLSLANAYIYRGNVTGIKSDKDSKGETIEGSSSGNKAKYIMGINTTDEQKNLLLSLTTSSKVKPTVEDLETLGEKNYSTYYSISNAESREKYVDLVSTGMNTAALNKYIENIGSIEGKKDSNGKTISGTLKTAKANYINSLNLTRNEKLLLFGKNYELSDSEKQTVLKYVNSLSISSKQKLEILSQLKGVTIKNNKVYW